MTGAPSDGELRERLAIAALWAEHDRLTAALQWISDQSAVAGTTVPELGLMASDTLEAGLRAGTSAAARRGYGV
jgi:hypothetical protein